MTKKWMNLMMAAAIAAVGAVSAATPAAATASTFGALVPSTFVTDYRTEIIPESGVKAAEVPCPAGKAVVSAGGGVTTTDGLVSIGPGLTSTSAVAVGRAGRGDIGRQSIGQATCAPNAQFAGSTVATRSTNVHSSIGEWTLTVTCPAGMRGFGGGGYFRARNGAISTDEYFLSANSLTANGRGWTVSAVNQTFTDTLVVTSRCLPQSTSTRLVESVYPIVPIVPGSSLGRASGYALCPAGFLPISGGAQFTQDGTPASAQARLIYSVLVERGNIGWFGSGISQGEHGVLHVVVLCGA